MVNYGFVDKVDDEKDARACVGAMKASGLEQSEWARSKAFVTFSDDPRSRYTFARRAARDHGVEHLRVRGYEDLAARLDERGWRGFTRLRAEAHVAATSEIVLARRNKAQS